MKFRDTPVAKCEVEEVMLTKLLTFSRGATYFSTNVVASAG